jgi:hypothetical protein
MFLWDFNEHTYIEHVVYYPPNKKLDKSVSRLDRPTQPYQAEQGRLVKQTNKSMEKNSC